MSNHYLYIALGGVVVILILLLIHFYQEAQPSKKKYVGGSTRPEGSLSTRKITPRTLPKGKIQTNADRLDFLCSKHSASYKVAPAEERKLVHLEFHSGYRKGEILSGSGDTMDEAVSDLADKLGDNV